MQKDQFWGKDWFAALAFSLVFITLAYGLMAASFQSLERYTYDAGVRARDRTPSDKIAVIAIDDQSIANIGRWPWPRNLHAEMIRKLKEGGARVIGEAVLLSEAQDDPGMRVIGELDAMLAASPLTQSIPNDIQTIGLILEDESRKSAVVAGVNEAYKNSSLAKDYLPAIEALRAKLAQSKASLAADDVLSKAIAEHGRVLLPMTFELGRPQGKPEQPLPDYVRRNALTTISDRIDARAQGATPIPTLGVQIPVASLGTAAAGIGALNQTPDIDGALRFEPLVLEHYDEYYPSFALAIAAAQLNLEPTDIEVRVGEGVTLGGLAIGTSSALRMYTHYYAKKDGVEPFPVDSFYDVFAGKIPASKYKDKVVLIGGTAGGIGDTFATPVASVMAPVLVLAHSVSSILQEDFFTRPGWAMYAELVALLLLIAYLAFVLPRLNPIAGAIVTLVLAASLLIGQIGAMASAALWLKLTIPAVFVVLGHLFLTVKKLNLTERLRQTSDAESAESNKMLGLAFQGQGQLDMAFEKFKRVQPVDDKLHDLMYNLALDFERKRQFNKAESVYQVIAEHNAEFRDVQQKLNRAKKLSETVILGGGSMGGATTQGGTMIMDSGDVEKPMLGRYQVEKELGKGAMGVVYLGKDPKINRMVAIKTMALSQEFEADELASVKERFFREAETAGRLTHPNIVSIFDAGDEHDLCYIAMEFLKGHDLVRYTKANALMPLNDVLKIVADAADALDYAHQQGVVHRDIKPANLMWLVESRIIKITDFGIARIADSSKTKTGMVLGTPSYMSPEQLSGKKVDGRSDLFSLGVTLYQLLTGALPFQADSMATLMFKIANEPHAPAGVLRPDLPPKLNIVVDRALNKDLGQRYQRGSEMARDLRFILSSLEGAN